MHVHLVIELEGKALNFCFDLTQISHFFPKCSKYCFNLKVIVVFISFMENPRKVGKTQKILIVCITALWVLTLCLVES